MSASIGRLSFIGRRPINFLKADVALTISACTETFQNAKFGKLPFAQTIDASGKFGQFNVKLVDGLRCDIQEGVSRDESRLVLSIDPEKYGAFDKYQRKFLKSMHGTTNSILMSHVEGITEGHRVSIQMVGVGYKAALEDSQLNLRVGFCHPVMVPVPSGIQVRVPNQTTILLFGADRQQLTQFAALIRSKRPPEPYNGKGIFVDNEQVRRKEGKKTK